MDATGCLCPEPVLRARRTLDAAEPGTVIAVLADDPLAEVDFGVFCQRTGHELLAVEAGVHGQRFLIRRAATGGA